MLELRDINKTYEHQPLLKGVSLTLKTGETICLLGASGSGKSTLLRLIAGLELPDSGQILWNGQDLVSTPAHLRDFGLVFQDYALFPHFDVFDNVAFGLKMKRWSDVDIKKRVDEVLSLVEMVNFSHRKVTELSGGEQQRVALARAMAPRPRMLMFDEPLGALDRALKDGLLTQLRAILHRTQIPAIYVTHDQDEAATIADRVLMLHNGQIVREGTPTEVWMNPGSVWAAEFLAVGNVVEGICMSRIKRALSWIVDTRYGRIDIKCEHNHKFRDHIHLLVLPTQTEGGIVLHGRVADVVFQHDRFKVTFDNALFVYLKNAPKIGQKVTVNLAVKCLG